jgi:hypothetical protein
MAIESSPQRTLVLIIIGGDVLGATEDFTPVVAERVDARLDSHPAEVAFEGTGDVGLASGWR